MTQQDLVPEYLQDFSSFAQHVRDEIGDSNSSRKGSAFSRAAAVLLPSTDIGQGFTGIEQNGRLSHDKGIDAISAVNSDGQQLYIQSKLTLDRKSDLDAILSNFFQYESHLGNDPTAAGALFGIEQLHPSSNPPIYVVVTLSDPAGVVRAYERSNLSTREFYDSLRADGRFDVVGGPDLLSAARREYSRAYMAPDRTTIRSSCGWLSQGQVRIGIVPVREILEIYRQHGDGLFFENIRSFLGFERNADRETVNRRIVRTIAEQPAEFLARNNGITLRASRVTAKETDSNQIELHTPSIVNGCQTTMCIVDRGEGVAPNAHVTVKVVEAEDAWEVTHSANYQNRVRQIDLDLARFLRPQLVERVASMHGIVVDKASSPIQGLLGEISAQRIAYEEVNYLYRGIFSSHPNELFDNNYNKLRTDVLEAVHERERGAEWLFERIFALNLAASRVIPGIASKYSSEEYQAFERYGKPQYKGYLTLLAAAGAVRQNLDTNQSDSRERADFIAEFLDSCYNILTTDTDKFRRTFAYAYQNLIETGYNAIDSRSGDAMIRQKLHQLVSERPFAQIFRQILVRVDGED